MLENKSEYSETVKSMTHGRPSRGRCGQPCMYEILQWEQSALCQKRNNKERQSENCPVSNSCVHNKEQWQVNEEKQIQERFENANSGNCEQKRQSSPQKEHPACKIHKKGHQIKNSLYMIEPVKLKKSHSVDCQNIKQTVKSPKINQHRKEEKKLDINNEKERKIIEEREEKIRKFKYYTRDLPNSAFTTYYGKPAFESYGRCNSQAHMRSHNVMPHKGENNPKQQESYFGALYHGKKVNHTNHIPRKPLVLSSKPVKTEDDQEEKIRIPMQKPDLVNHVRFSTPVTQKSKKQGIPQTSQTVSKKKKYEKPKKLKNKKKNKSSAFFNDGLKYMNIRDNLLEIMEKRKTKDSKLAYKITECYPLDWECQKQCNLETKYDNFIQMKPAGKPFQKGDDAKTVIYQKKELKL